MIKLSVSHESLICRIVLGIPFTYGKCQEDGNCEDVYFGNTKTLHLLDNILVNTELIDNPKESWPGPDGDVPKCTANYTTQHELESTSCSVCMERLDHAWCALRKNLFFNCTHLMNLPITFITMS